MKKTLNIFFVVLLTTLCIFYTNLISIAYAQETKLTPIMGESQATQEQAIQILKERNRIDNNDPKSDQYIEDFVNTTWEEAATEGVRADIAFSLMMLETNFLKSEYVDQNNFGGLGVYEGGAPASFDNVRLGIRAVVQHIKAYASTAHLVNECIDPRFKLITTRGCAEYLEWLGQKENPQGYGWATANGHGYRILNILNQMCGNPLTPFIHELNVTRSGSTYNITTQSTNADGALYKFVAINTTTGQQTVIQNYSQKSTATWTPSNSGSYIIKAYIKRPSSPYEYDAFTTCNVTVQNWVQTTIKSFTVDKPEVYAGQAFTATVVATSMNKPLYKFWIGEQSSDGKWSWTVIQNYSEKNYVTYTLKKPGIYGLSVYVKDSLSSIDPEVVKKCDVTVIASPTTIESFTVDKPEVYAGQAFTATVVATSMNKPLYKFWIGEQSSDGKWSWTVIQNYSEKNYVTYTLKKPGIYGLSVYVKDSLSSIDPEVVKKCDVTVIASPTTIESFTVDKPEVYAGQAFTATVVATSMNKPLYKFWIGEQSSDGKWSWTVIQNYSEKNYVTYTLKKPGIYGLSVYVKDSLSSIDPEVVKKCDVTVIASPTTIESFTVDKPEVYAGQAFTATVVATSMNKPLYKFWIGEQSSDGKWSWTVIQNYSEKNYVTYTLKKPGIYGLSVYVKDSLSSIDPEVVKKCDVTVIASPTTIESFTVDKPEVYAGQAFTATVVATSMNKPLYKFWIGEQSSDGKWSWTVIQNYSEKNYVTYTLKKPGIYGLSVYVKDSLSSIDPEVVKKCDVTVIASPTTIESFTVDKPEVYAGQAFTATVVATSMNKPLYKFWIGEQSSDGKWSWTVIQNYSEKNYVTYTLKKPGIYGLSVYVKDSLSSIDPEVVKKCDVTVIAIATIVLDAGHGGSDPGAVSSANTGSLKESDLNLQQTLILGNILESNGFNVIYTRDNKTSNPTLSERATLANDINADLFISIHHDSSTSKSAHGISTHYSTYRPLLDNEGLYVEYSSMWGDITCDATPCEAAVKSKNLAEKLAKNIASLGFYNRGAHDHNLYVTKMTTMPSVLIEVGFMSNDEEVLRVSNPNMMKAIAQKIADTIIEFFNIN